MSFKSTDERIKKITHSDLVKAAAAWLRRRCSVVITEIATTGEQPDAIGWSGAFSILVECKISLSDFRADKKKFFRSNGEYGMGCQRFYCMPKGMLNSIEELPFGWGLLEYDGHHIYERFTVHRSNDYNQRHEIEILLSTLRRIGINAPTGISIKCYKYTTKLNATVGIAQEESVESELH